jgi:lipopolysaccharide export LptBFGC system permease protein LptF
MKKITYILLMLFSIITYSQEKKKTRKTKDTDKAVNNSLDSLSKVYKKKVVYYGVLKSNGRKIEKIKYYDKNENLKEQIISDTPIE